MMGIEPCILSGLKYDIITYEKRGMYMLGFCKLFLLFIIYSFFGYIIEVTICSIESKKLVNRGFLVGPIIPVFGVGAVFITLLLTGYNHDPLVVFIFGLLLTSILEYAVGYVLEKIFHNKWWDYTNNFGNINGRVCLFNSLGFGIGSFLIIYVFNPFLYSWMDGLSNTLIIVVGIALLILVMADLIYSTFVAYSLRKNIIVVEELKNKKLLNVTLFLEKHLKFEIKSIKLNPDRLLKSFPRLREGSVKEFEIVAKFREKLKREKKLKNEKK